MDHLHFTELPGRADVVCFKDLASYILYELKNKPQTKEEILKSAAHLIKADIRELQQSKICIHLSMISIMMTLLHVGSPKV